MAIKKGLGRGLDMLIPREDTSHKAEASVEKKPGQQENAEPKEYDVEIDIRKIEPNRNQPRKQFDEDAIEELAESIKQFGVIQPLIVKKKGDYYEIIAGERRWRASKKAGLKKVPVIIKNYDEKEILKISLIENLQREDLNPIEEAQAYQKLQEDYGLKQDEIAASVSKSRTAITNTMRLLKLDERVQKMVMDNLISSGHGRTIIPIEDKELQYETACKILDENLSVREAEQLVKKLLERKPDKEKKEEESQQNAEMFHYFEGRMKDILGSKVTIKNKKNNKGRIEIEYYSAEELERIIDLIQSIQ
ncbi:MAG TPA: ParB/RepB/Spo0J family partition protein [Candidatus Anaerobutyricum avicola]|nr:ParB/RepB/Spo0J family partition protein [Candidatus Anaerobutyricum avicola]